MQITAEQVAAAVKDKGYHRVHVHNCSMCDYPCGYIFDGGDVRYDSGCDCTGRYQVHRRSYEDVADWVNMQSSPEWREKIWKQIQGEKADG